MDASPQTCLISLLERLHEMLNERAAHVRTISQRMAESRRWEDSRELQGEYTGLRHAAQEIYIIIETLRLPAPAHLLNSSGNDSDE